MDKVRWRIESRGHQGSRSVRPRPAFRCRLSAGRVGFQFEKPTRRQGEECFLVSPKTRRSSRKTGSHRAAKLRVGFHISATGDTERAVGPCHLKISEGMTACTSRAREGGSECIVFCCAPIFAVTVTTRAWRNERDERSRRCCCYCTAKQNDNGNGERMNSLLYQLQTPARKNDAADSGRIRHLGAYRARTPWSITVSREVRPESPHDLDTSF
jgi:hypothetical protein